MKSVFLAQTCKQSHMFVLLNFAKYLNFSVFADFQAFVIVVRS